MNDTYCTGRLLKDNAMYLLGKPYIAGAGLTHQRGTPPIQLCAPLPEGTPYWVKYMRNQFRGLAESSAGIREARRHPANPDP